jgi:hypothetical protein
MFLQFFHNSSLFGASGLAWGRIVEGKIVEELWKYLVFPVPGISAVRWAGPHECRFHDWTN